MRKLLTIGTLVFLMIFPCLLYPDEVSEMWGTLYKQAKTLRQKYEIMLNIVELDNRDVIPILIEALDELNQQRLYADMKEKVIQNDLRILVVRELGDLKVADASDEIFRVVRDAEDPYLKEEALIALGNVGAREYALNISLILRNLSVYRGEDVAAEEALANGCIYALEKFRDPVGFLPVFYASTAGFSRRITENAERALVNMVEDPSEFLTGLILTESSFEVKLQGLRAERRSGAPENRKFEIATQALNEGLINKPVDQDEETTLRELRRVALEVFIEIEEKNDKPVPLIEQVFYLNGGDDSEKIYAIEALKSIDTEEAAAALARYLAYQNDRQASGVTAKDNRIVIATIRALGSMSSKTGYRELLRAKFLGYPAVVGREAEKALKTME
ncbi:MAG: hypothetical protein AMS17_03735 [Spirochaetes bacterium DG_61]|jgi:hypothetical protein|nr:MAG: hypothetical protein AMS17_03735 [Spirochaetes bacterium DG_61]